MCRCHPAYDAQGRLDLLTNYGPDDTPEDLTDNPVLSAFDYERDPTGRIVHVDELVQQPDASLISATVDYVYDALGRLTREKRTSSASGEDYAIDYVLDLASNRLTKTTTKGATVQRVDSQYDARDRLLREDGFLDDVAEYSIVYGYDANGSQRTLNRTGALPETTAYDFDVRNRLAGMQTTRTLANSDVEHRSASYTYNDDGIRVSKQETRALNSDPATTATTYLIDDSNVTGYAQAIEEREATATGSSVTPPAPTAVPTVSYVFGIQLISQTRPDGGGDPVPSFYLQDAHSGVRQLVALPAAPLDPVPVTDAYRYQSFGTLLAETHLVGGATPNTHLYRAEVWDSGLGLTYLRARYLNHESGRFVGMDPWEGSLLDPLTFQDFGYGHHDPVEMVDPTGWGAEFAVLAVAHTLLGAINIPQFWDQVLEVTRSYSLPEYLAKWNKDNGTAVRVSGETPSFRRDWLYTGIELPTSVFDRFSRTHTSIISGNDGSFPIGILLNEFFHAWFYTEVESNKRAPWLMSLIDSEVQFPAKVRRLAVEEAMSEMLSVLGDDRSFQAAWQPWPTYQEARAKFGLGFGTPGHEDTTFKNAPAVAANHVSERIYHAAIWVLHLGVSDPRDGTSPQPTVEASLSKWFDLFRCGCAG